MSHPKGKNTKLSTAIFIRIALLSMLAILTFGIWGMLLSRSNVPFQYHIVCLSNIFKEPISSNLPLPATDHQNSSTNSGFHSHSNETLLIEDCFDLKNCHILPDQYRDCILSLQNESLFSNNHAIRCHLPWNMSFTVHNVLGSGLRAHTFSVSFDGDNAQRYALKLAARGDYCRHSREEYEVLTKLEKYNEQIKDGQNPLNFGLLHRDLPFFYFRNYPVDKDCVCIIFVQQIPNSITLGNLMDVPDLLPSITNGEDDQDVTHITRWIDFISDCHDDVVSVYSALHSLNEYYQDTSYANIMIDTETKTCYLIDFGGTFSLSDRNLLGRVGRHHRVYCITESCAPYVYYHLFTPTQRQETMQNLKEKNKDISRIQVVTKLREWADISNRYRLSQLFETYFMSLLGTDEVFSERWGQIFALEKSMKHSRKIANEERLLRMWCARYAQMTILRKALDGDTSITNVDRLWSVFQVFEIDTQFINVTECNHIHGL